MFKTALFLLALLASADLCAAQTDFSTRNPVGLFQDLQADTVTSDLFHHFAPTPHVAFHVTRPVPGKDIYGDVSCLAALDFDNDGDQDVVVGGSAYPDEPPARLLLNRGDGSFDVAGAAGLPTGLLSFATGDFDNDGWTDLVGVVVTGGIRLPGWVLEEAFAAAASRGEPWRIRLVVLRNREGRDFQPVLETDVMAGGADESLLYWARLVLVLDADRDGWLDLLLVHPRTESEARLRRWRGGPQGFTGGEETQIEVLLPARITVLDLDGDGDPDLLTQGGGFSDRLDRGTLDCWLNDGGNWGPGGEFSLPRRHRETSLLAGDVNNDGLFDLFAGSSDYQGGTNQLYVNLGGGKYEDQGRQMGLWAGYNFTEGAAWADWDQDTFVDLVQFRTFNEGRTTESALFLNDGGRRFLNVTGQVDGPTGPGSVAGLALDADRDGDLDILLSHAAPFIETMPLAATGMQLLRNDSRTGHWLEVRLQGTVSNRSALGGQAAVHLGPVALHRQVAMGASWGRCQPQLPMHFGLGAAAAADSITVRWPSGGHEVFAGVAADRQVELVEGQGRRRW